MSCVLALNSRKRFESCDQLNAIVRLRLNGQCLDRRLATRSIRLCRRPKEERHLRTRRTGKEVVHVGRATVQGLPEGPTLDVIPRADRESKSGRH